MLAPPQPTESFRPEITPDPYPRLEPLVNAIGGDPVRLASLALIHNSSRRISQDAIQARINDPWVTPHSFPINLTDIISGPHSLRSAGLVEGTVRGLTLSEAGLQCVPDIGALLIRELGSPVPFWHMVGARGWPLRLESARSPATRLQILKNLLCCDLLSAHAIRKLAGAEDSNDAYRYMNVPVGHGIAERKQGGSDRQLTVIGNGVTDSTGRALKRTHDPMTLVARRVGKLFHSMGLQEVSRSTYLRFARIALQQVPELQDSLGVDGVTDADLWRPIVGRQVTTTFQYADKPDGRNHANAAYYQLTDMGRTATQHLFDHVASATDPAYQDRAAAVLHAVATVPAALRQSLRHRSGQRIT